MTIYTYQPSRVDSYQIRGASPSGSRVGSLTPIYSSVDYGTAYIPLRSNLGGVLYATNEYSIQNKIRVGGIATTLESRIPLISASFYRFGNLLLTEKVYRSSGGTYMPYETPCSFNVITGTIPKDMPMVFQLFDSIEDSSSTKSFTVEIALPNGASSLTDQDVWVDLIYPLSSSPLGKVISSRTAPKVTGGGTTLTSSSVTWNGISSPVKQKITVSTTSTGREGQHTILLYVAAQGYNLYVCPLVDVT